MDLVDGRRRAILDQRLERQLEIGQGVGVEQLAQLLLAEQLAQQVAVERERAGPALGQRRVAVVHVRRDVVEQQAARERARLRCLDAVDGDLAARDAAEDLAQRVEVEHVRQALAIGLDEDREAAVAAGDGQQVGRSLALLPERRPGPGSSARQQQGPRRVLAEPAGEQRRVRDLADDQILDVLGGREQQLLDAVEAGLALGHPDRDAVVRPDRLDLHPEAFLRAAPRWPSTTGHGRAPRTGVSRRQPPVAELVAEPLDDDPPVGRQGAGRLALVLEVGEQVLGGALVEVVVLAQARVAAAARPFAPRPRSASISPTNAPSARPSSIGRPTASPFQNGSLPGTPGAGVTVTRSWPISWTRQELAPSTMTSPCMPGAELVDHLLVELADAPARRSRLARHEHAEQAAVRDRAAAGDGDDPGVAATLDGVGDPVPDEARLELGELVGRVRAGEHPEDAVEDVAGQRLVRRRPGDRRGTGRRRSSDPSRSSRRSAGPGRRAGCAGSSSPRWRLRASAA